MRKVFAMAVLFSTLPFCAGAQAGFPDRSLWLSNIAPSSGEEIQISTVLYNGTNEVISGTLSFLIDDAKLSSQELSLPAQSSSIVSAPWGARPGTHTLSARFESREGIIPAQQTSLVTINVPEPPPPTALQEGVSKATVVAGQFASSSAPIVQKVAQAVFAQTEALRNAGAERLKRYMEDSPRPTVAGNSSSTPSAAGFAASAASDTDSKSGDMLHSLAQTAAAAAHFVFRSIYLFYLLFVALLFSLLTFAYRRLRRPGR